MPKLKGAPMKLTFSFFSFLLSFPLTSAEAALFTRPSECAAAAADLVRVAVKQGRRHVAVVPFRDTSGNLSRDGAIISERLVAYLTEGGALDVVERSHLEAVMEELRLGITGGVDPATVKRLGHFLGVDAIVTGSAVQLTDNEVEVHARLIDVETARVLWAATARVPKDWSDFENASIWAVVAPPIPVFPEERRRPDWHDGLRSATAFPAAPVCDSTDDRVIETRARYWALRLRDPGFSNASLRFNPGSEILDPGLRDRFYSRLRAWSDEESIPPLNDTDQKLLARCD